MEIEKKYLVKNNYEMVSDFITLMKPERFEIEQVYVKEEDGVKRYRSRKKEGEETIYYQTMKSGKGLVREEIEKEIPKKDYKEAIERYKTNGIGMPIIKSRWVFTLENYVYELDIFHSSLSPLVVIEVEFKTKEEALAHTLPKEVSDIVVREVTEDSRYVNQVLTQINKRDDILKLLED